MRLHLNLHRSGDTPRPVLVVVDDAVSVGTLAATLAKEEADLTLGVHSPQGVRSVPRATPIGDAGVRSGDTVSLIPEGAGHDRDDRGTAVVFKVTEGPLAGREIALPSGSSTLGRDRSCSVRLNDPTVSKRHLRVNAGETLEVIDLGSANGMLVDGVPAMRAELRPGSTITLGDTVMHVHRFQPSDAQSSRIGIPILRSPRVEVRYPEGEHPAPEPPTPPQHQRIPLLAVFSPILFAGVLYLVTRNPSSMIFAFLSPVMMLSSALETRLTAKREMKRSSKAFDEALAAFEAEMAQRQDAERAARLHEHPGTTDVMTAIDSVLPVVWCRRRDRPGFLQVRVGLGSQPSRSTVRLPTSNRTTPEHWARLLEVEQTYATVDQIPVVADLADSGALGVAGEHDVRLPVARALLMQLFALHSPADLVVTAIAPSAAAKEWDWLTWLPHTWSSASPLTCEPFASTSGASTTLISAIEAEIVAREEKGQSGDAADDTHRPAILLIVDSKTPVERARLVDLAERGPKVAVYTFWLAPRLAALPAVCRDYVLVSNVGESLAGHVVTDAEITPLTLEPLADQHADRLARAMAPWFDASFAGADDAAIPSAVTFLSLAGEAPLHPTSVIETWRETGSILSETAGHRRRAGNLRALVGISGDGAVHLDLREQGPHALVGGTTGAGKSELLQTWILGMAVAHSPERVNFLLVDYKGGSAFADCVHLPHTVGLVTDLTPHLVQRALTSLDAELKYREHLLHDHRAKDIIEFEKSGSAATLPSLVIIVDEFAALVSEVPEFVDGMVNIAQRGRSLGLHLILATQRPTGVIRDNLRANTNLRVALRLADSEDSVDVLGTDVAATFPADVPGRAAARTGPGRLKPFQTAYVGGWSVADTAPTLDVWDYRFGTRVPWAQDDDDEPVDLGGTGPNDIRRMVTATREAADELALPPARQPWLPVLADTYRLLDVPNKRTDTELVIGARDEPEKQARTISLFRPDRDGNMVVFGTGGSGKSATLRTLAAAAGMTARGGPCHVYGLDFGARGLAMVEVLPHVGSIIPGDDHDRVVRLLRWLRTLVDDRAVRYARVNAGTISEYRSLTGDQAEPRILLLLDGLAAFRQAYEIGPNSRWFDALQSIAADGRQVGVHLIVTADRPGSLPPALSSVIQCRLVLRMASEADLAMLGLRADVFADDAPPGRGFLDSHEVQVAILGGEANVAAQARETKALADRLRRGGIAEALPINSLPERVILDSLPASEHGLPALGLADDALSTVGFPDTGVLLVTGPPQSGRTTALATIAVSYARHRPQAHRVLLTGRRSSLLNACAWSAIAQGEDAVAELATELCSSLASDTARPTLIVVERLPDFASGATETPLGDLVKVCREYGHLLVAEAETSAVSGGWGLISAIKASRQGLALQPDQADGEMIFRTQFPRAQRSEFPQGRGFLVAGGKASKVQVAMPE